MKIAEFSLLTSNLCDVIEIPANERWHYIGLTSSLIGGYLTCVTWASRQANLLETQQLRMVGIVESDRMQIFKVVCKELKSHNNFSYFLHDQA